MSKAVWMCICWAVCQPVFGRWGKWGRLLKRGSAAWLIYTRLCFCCSFFFRRRPAVIGHGRLERKLCTSGTRSAAVMTTVLCSCRWQETRKRGARDVYIYRWRVRKSQRFCEVSSLFECSHLEATHAGVQVLRDILIGVKKKNERIFG